MYHLVLQHSSVSVTTARECSSYYKSSHGPNYIRCNHDTPGSVCTDLCSCTQHSCVCCQCRNVQQLSLSVCSLFICYWYLPFNSLSLSHNYLVYSACVSNWFLCELWKCWMWLCLNPNLAAVLWLMLIPLPCYYLHYRLASHSYFTSHFLLRLVSCANCGNMPMFGCSFTVDFWHISELTGRERSYKL